MTKKRLLSALLCCVMLLTLLPATALAAQNTELNGNSNEYYFYPCGAPSAAEAVDNYFLFYFSNALPVLAGDTARWDRNRTTWGVTYDGPRREGNDYCIVIRDDGLQLEPVTDENGQTYFYIKKLNGEYYKRYKTGASKYLGVTSKKSDATVWAFESKGGDEYRIKEKDRGYYWIYDDSSDQHFSVTSSQSSAVGVRIYKRRNPTYVISFAITYHDQWGKFGFQLCSSFAHDIETGKADTLIDGVVNPIRVTVPCFAMKGFQITNIIFFHDNVTPGEKTVNGGREPGDYLDTAKPDIVILKANSKEGPSNRTDTTDIQVEIRYKGHVTRSGRGINEPLDSDYDVLVPGNCSKAGTRVLVCEQCRLEVFRDTQSYGGHDWGRPAYAWNEDHSACTAARTCKTNGNHKETASATVRTEITPPTCTADGTRTYTAEFDAGWAGTQTYRETVASEGHTYGDWTEDGEAGHFRVCTDENCPDADKGRETAPHDFDGDSDADCNTCGYTRTIDPPVHAHTYGDWTEDGESGHFRVCTDENCPDADKGRETAPHDFDGDSDADCNTCGYTRTIDPPVHAHTYGDWTEDGETGHFRVCTDENCPDADKGRETAPHDFDGDSDADCNTCGYTRTIAPATYTVTLNPNGGTINRGGITEYTYGVGAALPAADDMTYPGFTFMGWYESENLSGDPVTAISPTDTGDKTFYAKWNASEQFSLTPGGTYYFDLSGENIPGTKNDGNEDDAAPLPDLSLHYVPFTYAGTVYAYKLLSELDTTEEYAAQNRYPHSLFIADNAVTHTVSWEKLDSEGLIFGRRYGSRGVDYTMRAPSTGSYYDSGPADAESSEERGTPKSNEWDAILNKDDGYIRNWTDMFSWGQDTYSIFYDDGDSYIYRSARGYQHSRYWAFGEPGHGSSYTGFRPVLEVRNADTLGSGGMRAVTLDLNGAALGGSSDDIQIVVKSGSTYAAPAAEGLTVPTGRNADGFHWTDDRGNAYAPGELVPADVDRLTAQFTPNTYTVTLNPNGGTIDRSGVTAYTYGVGAALPAADDMTYPGHTFMGWYESEDLSGSPVAEIGKTETGNREYWAKWVPSTYAVTLNPNGGTIDCGGVTAYTYGVGAALPAADDMTYPGHTFMGWYESEDLSGSPVAEIGKTETGDREYWAKWEVNTYAVTLNPNGGTIDRGGITAYTYGVGAALPAADDMTRTGYTFRGWYADSGFTGAPVHEISRTDIGDKAFYARWTADVYTITYDLDGGSAAGNPGSYTVETAAFTLTPPTRPGYVFTGWSGTGLAGEDNQTVTVETGSTGDRAYRAHWRYIGSDHAYYMLRFETNGGSAIPDAWFRSGTTADLSGYTPVRQGFTFTGWYSDKGLTDGITAIRMDGSKTVYAGWQKQAGGNPFADVHGTDWFYDDVMFACGRGLMTGTGSAAFSPRGTATRAMMAAILWRMEGSPAPKRAPEFTDVASGTWYSDAVAWTTENGIYQGYGNGTFRPDEPITREQLAAIFFRCALRKGCDTSAGGSLTGFADQNRVSAWAQDALQWAVGSGLMQGKGASVLDPQGTATRAEIAAMLHRFIERCLPASAA